MSLISLANKLWWPRMVTATLGSTSGKLSLLVKLMTFFVISFLSLPAVAQTAKESGWELSFANGLVLFKREVKQTTEPGNVTDTAQEPAFEQPTEPAGNSLPDYFMPAIESHLEASISGIVSRTKITQIFRNPYDEWLDGTYQFPLPEDAAVDGLMMRIGQREIVGQIKEKQVARAIFNRAKANGQKASLVNQVKANMFTTELTNIAPYEEIRIEIQLQQKARYKNGEFQLRFPTTYTPRFAETDPDLTDVRALNGGEPGAGKTAEESAGNFRFDIILDAGDALNYVASPHFDAQVETQGLYQKHIRSSYSQAANRDLELLWRYQASAPKLLHYRQADIEGEYGLVMLLPGMDDTESSFANERFSSDIQREVTLVIDTSSSMAGASIRQAKAALAQALAALQPEDKFNLVEFNSEAQALWSEPQLASPENINAAGHFLNALKAQGGTNIYAALDLAIVTQRQTSDLQQIVFITDGAIGYEEQLLQELSTRIGEARLFTVGIGSAPNSYFMVEAAKTGRGTFTHIASPDQVATRMSHLLTQLAKPAITDLALDFGMEVEQYPKKLPDLYLNEPLVVSYKAPQAIQDIWAFGNIAGGQWQMHRQTDYLQGSDGISKLWANEKIRQLMAERRLMSSSGEADSDEIKAIIRNVIVDVALKHGLVSKFTSLVAVEQQISNPGLLAEKVQFGQLVPASRMALMHSMPQTATTANQSFLFGLGFLLIFILVVFKPELRRIASIVGESHVSK